MGWMELWISLRIILSVECSKKERRHYDGAFILCYIAEHEYEMTDAARHNEEVEDFVGSEVRETSSEYFDLQSVDDTSYCVEDTTGKEPQECGVRQYIPKRTKYP